MIEYGKSPVQFALQYDGCYLLTIYTGLRMAELTLCNGDLMPTFTFILWKLCLILNNTEEQPYKEINGKVNPIWTQTIQIHNLSKSTEVGCKLQLTYPLVH